MLKANINDAGVAVAAEQQLLGAILMDTAALDRVADILTSDHFFDPFHGFLFDLCRSRVDKGHMVSPPSIAAALDGHEGLKAVGGPAYLVRLAGAAIGGNAARHYAETIIDLSSRRSLATAAKNAAEDLDRGADAADVRARLDLALQALPVAQGQETTITALKAMTRAVESAVEAYQGQTSFLKTGVPALDGIIKGLGPSDFMLIGGTTSMGKTSLALEIATQVSLVQAKPTAFWSLEMTPEQLMTRMASSRSRIPYSAIRDAAEMEEADFRKWVEASQDVTQANLRIIPKFVREIAGGYSALRRIKREMGGLSLVIVDYAQLLRGTGKSRFEQMTEVSIGLKHMAGMLECPVIGLVQLSRDIAMRDDKRPHLPDIKETGQFENDADQVVFCHRESYYLERQGPKASKDGTISNDARTEWEADLAASKNVMELLVRKNRHGRLGTVEIGFHEATNRFWEIKGRETFE